MVLFGETDRKPSQECGGYFVGGNSPSPARIFCQKKLGINLRLLLFFLLYNVS